MRKILFAFVFMCMLVPRAWADVSVDSANFPDDDFREYVSSNFDTDSDGVLSDAEIANATAIDVSGSNISSLEGIKHFTALTTLNCQNTSLTALDVSSNTSLATLNCYNSKLAALDVGSNTALTNISCSAQSVSPLRITETGDSEYPYQLDFTNYMTSAQTANVSVVNGYSGSSSFSGTYADSIAKFASKPSSVTYHYATGYSTLIMDVTLSGEANSSGGVAINATNFPDDIFRSYVSTNFDSDNDGSLSDLEILAAASLDISGQGISSLKGIEHFTALNLMNCSSNDLTSLIITANVNLIVLDCSYNQLKSLNVSRNTALTELYCKSNQLQALDVSKNTALTILECQRNQIRTLDLSNNTALTELFCQSNQLTALDLGGNTALTEAECAPQERIGLSVISTSYQTAPYQLDFSKYMTSAQYDAYVVKSSIQGLDLNGNNISMSYSDTSPSSDERIVYFASIPSAMTYVYSIGSTVPMDASDGTLTIRISDSGGVEINSTNFPDDKFRAYVSNDCDTDNDGVLSDAEIAEVTYIYLNSKDIASLTGIEYFTALTDLDCQNNQLTELDVSKNTALTALDCSINQLTTLDMSNNTALTWLDCFSNQLTALDVSNNTALTHLDCLRNQLTALDVSNNTALTELRCGSNDLTALDVSSNTALTTLDCDENQLTALDVSSNTALRTLDCSDNQLIELDVSNNAALTSLYCSYNKLTALDISNNNALRYLHCGNNQLTALNVSNNTALRSLSCHINQLKTLDVSNNTALTNLRCNRNQLTTLDVSNNTALTELYCHRNQLTTLDVSNNTALTILSCHSNQLTALDVNSNTTLTTLYCYSQAVSPLNITSTGDSSYPYQLDFISLYMSSYDAFTNVSDVQGLDSSSTNIATTYVNGAAMFASFPAKVTYYYNTGYTGSGGSMDVTISGSDSSSVSVSVNEANFPDSNFRSYITSNFDTDNDGVLSDTEISGITEIQADSQGIQSLSGIENFGALEYLSCGSNDISSLDVSKNTALAYLNFWGNNVSSIDLSKNTALKEIYFYDNNISSVDFSGNTEIISIDCVHNGLRYIDVSGCTKLEFLNVYDNLLTELDVSNCTRLNNLSFGSNDVSEIDLSNNPLITYLGCNENRLATLDLSGMSGDITELYMDSQMIDGMTITGTGDSSYPYQLDFSAYMYPDKFANVSDVQGIDSGNGNITTTYADGIARFASYPSSVQYNYATGYGSILMDVTISGAGLSSGDVEINATNFQDDVFREYVRTEFDTDNDGVLSDTEIANVTSIDVDGMNIASLTGVEYFTALATLHCYNNQLTQIDVSKNTALTSLNCGYNQLTELDVSNNTALMSLSCYNNQLTALDVSSNTALTTLYCYGNQLTALDLNNNTALTDLACSSNQLTTLDVSSNTALTYLWCNSQDVSPLTLTNTGDSSYLYQLDFSAYMTSEQTANVSGVQGLDSNNGNITTAYADGVAKFASRPAKVTYNYATGYGTTTMDVTISGDSSPVPAGPEISTTNFPDSAFRSYISANFDTDGDGALSDSEVANVTSIDVDGMNISSLTGVEYFTALATLHCYNNQLTHIDVSKNTALIELFCGSNELYSLDVSSNTALQRLDCTYNQLTTLDVSKNTALTDLLCGFNQLTELDVSKNTALLNLACSDNQLTELDVSKNTALWGLSCRDNQLTTLDVSHNTALTHLDCENNFLTALDVSNNTSLITFNCFSNDISSLDVTSNTALTTLSCGSNRLTVLDVSNNTALEYLNCSHNQLTELDVSNNTALTYLRCHMNKLAALDLGDLSSLTSLDCYSQDVSPLRITRTGDSSYPYMLDFSSYMTSEQTANIFVVQGIDSNSADIKTTYSDGVAKFASLPAKVTYLYASYYDSSYSAARTMDVTISGSSSSGGGLEISAENFPDDNFRSYLTANFDTDGDGSLSDSEIANVTSINVQGNGISSLRGVEYFTALTYLNCWGNQLTELDVSKNTALTTLLCGNNNLNTLDVSKNTALTELLCNYTHLTELDVSNNTALVSLDIGSNDITALDVSKNTNLRMLVFGENKLTELDVSSNTKLTQLDCSNNRLTSLDVSNNTALTRLYCHSNQLTALDLSKNTALTDLACHWNQLKELDLSNNTALDDLVCHSNQLTALDVSNNTALIRLHCSSNQLTEFDVSRNTALEFLNFARNQINAIDLSNNTSLTYLHCHVNKLAALDLSNNTALTELWCYSQDVSPLRITNTGDSSYPYMLDFASYISPDNFANISNVQGLDSNSADITTTYANGIARFASRPSSVKYDYATGYDSVMMDVTISSSDVAIDSTKFPDSAFRSYISSNFDSDNNGVLSESEISAVTWINVDSMNISSLKGIELFTSLNGLSCTGNRLTELDLSRNTALTEVWAMSNDIASLNVNGCTSLRKLGLHENNLTQLDVSNLPSLEELHCGDMNLSTLTIGNKPSLTQLYCYRNQLTALDVTGCPALTHLHFGGNRISSIDLSKCTSLEYLHCWSNNLAELDLSGLTSLKNLNCSDNALRVLDLSGSALTEFNADNQSFNAPVIYSTGDPSYPYRADLSAYVTAGNVANIVNVYAYDSGGSSIGTVYENGTARFASLPSTLTYTYSTGGGNMNVNVSYGNASVMKTPPPAPDIPVIPSPNSEDNVTPTPATPQPTRINQGRVTVNGHRYAVYDIKLTWTDAQAYCESLGGHLATIRTREEQEAISAMILESDAEAYWLGGRRNDSGSWMWLDGSEWNFTNWDTDHGQNGDSGERLLIYGPAYSGTPSAFYASDETLGTPGKWGSAPANTDAALYGFICEWREDQPQLETAIVSPITRITDDLRERLANLVSIDRSEVNFITSAEINPSEAREPTQAMRQSLADQSGEFLAKLNTIKVNKDGWYALVVTVSDDLVGASVSNLRLFYAEESDFAEGSLSASFGLMPIVNGITGGLEITNLFGVKLDTLPKQFIAMMMLSAGKSLSVYIVKILLMLLAGCSTGAGALIVLVMFIAKRYRKK